MVPIPVSARLQSLPVLPTIKWGPSGADSWVGWIVHILGPCGSLQQLLLWGWEFLVLLPQPPQVFSIRGLRLYFPPHWSPGLCGLLRCPTVPPGLSMHECGATGSASGRAACPIQQSSSLCVWPVNLSPLSPGSPSPRLRPSYRSWWMSLLYLFGCRTSPQFDFLSVLVIFVLKLLLSFPWLCKEAQYVYLRLRLGSLPINDEILKKKKREEKENIDKQNKQKTFYFNF